MSKIKTDIKQQIKIVFLSAHSGADAWVEMCDHINQEGQYLITIFNQYNDQTYRKTSQWFLRLFHRISTYTFFPFRCLLHKQKIISSADILLVNTSPFYMPVLVSLFYPRQIVKIALLNDIYPEALVQNNFIKKGGLIEYLLKIAVSKSLKQFNQVVVISEQHLRFVKRVYGLNINLSIIPVPAQICLIAEPKAELPGAPVHVLYCGTLGLMHEIDTFLNWCRYKTAHDFIKFDFYTSGALKSLFEKSIHCIAQASDKKNKNKNINLGDALNRQSWVDLMKKSHVGLVFQGRGAGNVVFPSKMASILASGQAVLAIADYSSEVAKMIRDNDCGWVVEPLDINGLDLVFSSLSNVSIVNRKRHNAYVFGNSYFGKEAVAKKWQDLFNKCKVSL